MKQFWEVVFDELNKTFEVVGISDDDRVFNFNVSSMIREGMKVRNETPDAGFTEIEVKGQCSRYKEEKGLYKRLLSELEQKSGKAIKRW